MRTIRKSNAQGDRVVYHQLQADQQLQNFDNLSSQNQVIFNLFASGTLQTEAGDINDVSLSATDHCLTRMTEAVSPKMRGTELLVLGQKIADNPGNQLCRHNWLPCGGDKWCHPNEWKLSSIMHGIKVVAIAHQRQGTCSMALDT